MSATREAIYEALFEKFLVAQISASTVDPVTYTVTVVPTGFYIQDQGVVYHGGAALVKVYSAPAVGQYMQSGATYTFNALDASAAVDISFLSSPLLRTASRRLKTWDQVGQEDQPALFFAETGEDWQQLKGLPVKRTMSVEVYLYVFTGADSSLAPSQVLNPILDALEAAIGPDACGYQTLGGLVSHAWIDGKVSIAEGAQGQGMQAIAMLPVSILVP